MSKKILSLLLAVVMVALSVSTLIVPSFAAEEAGDTVKPTANTGFNLLENFVLKEASDSWLTAKPTVTNTGAWQAGQLNASFNAAAITAEADWSDYLSIGDTFYPFDSIKSYSTYANWVAVERDGLNGGGRRSLGLCLVDSNLTNNWAIYLATGLNYDFGSAGAGIVDYNYTPALRYVAQFGGNLTVTLDGGWHGALASGYQHLLVRHNGEVLEDIVNDNGADVSKTCTFDVKKGDVIEFISLIDPILSGDYSSKNTAAQAAWEAVPVNKNGEKELNDLRRGFRIDDIDIEYNTFTSDSKWDSSVLSNANVLAYNNTNVLFFRTYEDGVKVNTDLYELCGIDENTTLTEAYNEFCAYLKKNSRITVNSSEWSYGNVVTTTANYSAACQFQSYDPFMYYAYYYNTNLLKAASSNGFYATEADWDKMMTTIMDDLLASGLLTAGDVTVNADNASTVTVGELVASSNNASLPVYYGLDWKNFTNPPSIGKVSGEIRSGENKLGNAGFCYTAPAAGKLTITMDSMTMLDQNGNTFTTSGQGYKWNLAVNGVFKYTGGNWQATDFTEVTVDVEAGDEVIVVIFRNLATNFKPTFTASLTSDLSSLTFDTNASLVIDDAYSVKMTATPSAADGVITALVDGEWVEGTLEDGEYVFMLKEGIKVSELTATTKQSAAWENCNRDGVAVSYQLKEVVNGHTLTSSVYSTTTDKMLSYYEASTNPAVAALAKDIRHLAVAANAALNNPDGSLGDIADAEKFYIRGKSDDALTELKAAGALHSFTGEADKYQIAAANVNLDDRLSVVLLMAANEGGTLEDLRNNGYYVNAVCGGKSYDGGDTIRSVFIGDKEYMGVIINVPISMWDQMVEYTIMDADGNAVSKTLNYSVKAWCVNKYKSSSASSPESYVVRAMYNLGNSAAAYKASL